MASPRPATTHKQSTKSGKNKNITDRSTRVGRAVQVARNLRGLTQRELAAEVGCSQNYVWLVESGKTDPGIGFLADVAAHLEVPTELFLLAVVGPKSSSGPERVKLFREGQGLLFQLIDALADAPKPTTNGTKKRKQKSK